MCRWCLPCISVANVQVVSSVYFCRKCAGGIFRVFLSQMQPKYFFILKRNKNIKVKVYIMFRRK